MIKFLMLGGLSSKRVTTRWVFILRHKIPQEIHIVWKKFRNKNLLFSRGKSDSVKIYPTIWNCKVSHIQGTMHIFEISRYLKIKKLYMYNFLITSVL